MKKYVLLLAAPLLLSSVPAQADAPVVGVLQGMSVLGKGSDHIQGNQDRVPAGGPLKVAIAGTGTCTLKIELRHGDSLMFSRTTEAKLPFTYVGDWASPPYVYGHEDYVVRISPVSAPGKICGGSSFTEKVTFICVWSNCNTKAPGGGLPGSGPSYPPPAPSTPSKPSLGLVEVPNQPKPANGTITGMNVPGGSFGEDETQRIHVSGSGGCALDLHITNKSYGGNFDKTFSVNPMNLAGNAELFNGTHFDTLAEGSYSSEVTGKGGCSGTAKVDFKVGAKSITGHVIGKPGVKLDKLPQNGTVFTSKDSNVWFKVDAPGAFKSVPNVGCCEIEFDYKNGYGGWEVSTSAPVSDPGFNPNANNNQPAPKSVSYFKVPSEAAMQWRMRIRGYRYKTSFEWSDWLEFKVSQQ